MSGAAAVGALVVDIVGIVGAAHCVPDMVEAVALELALFGGDSGVLVSPVVHVGEFVEALGSSAQAGASFVLTQAIRN